MVSYAGEMVVKPVVVYDHAKSNHKYRTDNVQEWPMMYYYYCTTVQVYVIMVEINVLLYKYLLSFATYVINWLLLII